MFNCFKTLLSDLFFSKFEKYLEFLSLFSTYCALALIILPFIRWSMISVRFTRLLSISVFNCSITFLSVAFWILSSKFSIMSFVLLSVSSSLRFLFVANLIVSLRIFPFITSHNVLGLALLFIRCVSKIHLLTTFLYSISKSRLLLNLK